jgi:steroid Delta-isomerase
MTVDARVTRLQQFFETLSRSSLAAIGSVYAEDAWFKDPFNEVRGAPSVRRVFEHMFDQVTDPRFVVTRAVSQGDHAFLTWDFQFRMNRLPDQPQVIRGASHIQSRGVSPGLLGRRGGTVRKAANPGRADEVPETPRRRVSPAGDKHGISLP